ncbi:MAG: GNAT family N-acetyltransferase [Pseudomonadota bacterium]
MTVVIETTNDLAACLDLRHRVFVLEQGVPVEEERDAHDERAIHLLARVDGAAAGTARILFDGDTAKIGRVCVLSDMRGQKLGVSLIEKAVEVARHKSGITRVKLGAQITALGFYEKLGFVAEGAVFLDAGLEHRTMVRAL